MSVHIFYISFTIVCGLIILMRIYNVDRIQIIQPDAQLNLDAEDSSARSNHKYQNTELAPAALHKEVITEDTLPYSNISKLYEYLKTGIEGQEHLYNISYSLQNRFKSKIYPEVSWSLPSLLHFIWIGATIREKYVDSINLFSQHNPNYKVILWTDNKTLQMNTTYKFRPTVETKDLTRLLPQMVNSDIMAKLKNVGAVTDLMKYEIIYMFGGIYTDTDSHSLKPIGEALRYSFTAPGVPPNLIPAGIFGFPKGSRFLLFVMSAARERFLSPEFKRFPIFIQFGPTFISTAFVQYNDPKIRMISANYLLQRTPNISIMYQTNDQSWG